MMQEEWDDLRKREGEFSKDPSGIVVDRLLHPLGRIECRRVSMVAVCVLG